MNILKGVIINIFKVILFNVIFLFVLSFSIKGLFSSSFIKNVIKDQVVENVSSSLELQQINNSLMFENKEIDQLISKYIDKTIEGIIAEDEIGDISISEDIISYIKEHEVEFEDELGVQIDTAKLDEMLLSDAIKEFDVQYRNAINNTRKSIPESQRKLLKIYEILVSSSFKFILVGIMTFLIIIIALLQKSVFRWIKTVALLVFTSGIFLFIMGAIVTFIVNQAILNMQMNISFDATSLYINGGVVCFVGLLLFISYLIIKYISNKKRVGKDEVSEVFE